MSCCAFVKELSVLKLRRLLLLLLRAIKARVRVRVRVKRSLRASVRVGVLDSDLGQGGVSVRVKLRL